MALGSLPVTALTTANFEQACIFIYFPVPIGFHIALIGWLIYMYSTTPLKCAETFKYNFSSVNCHSCGGKYWIWDFRATYWWKRYLPKINRLFSRPSDNNWPHHSYFNNFPIPSTESWSFNSNNINKLKYRVPNNSRIFPWDLYRSFLVMFRG